MQFDRLVAARHQFFSEPSVVFGRRQAAFQRIAAHGAAVRGNLVAVAADQLVDRLLHHASGEVPERLFDHRQRAIGQLSGAAALPVREILPDVLTHQRVLPDHRLAHERIENEWTDHFRRCERVARTAVIRLYGQHGHFDQLLFARVRVSGAVHRAAGRIGKHHAADFFDLHVVPDFNVLIAGEWPCLSVATGSGAVPVTGGCPLPDVGD